MIHCLAEEKFESFFRPPYALPSTPKTFAVNGAPHYRGRLQTVFTTSQGHALSFALIVA